MTPRLFPAHLFLLTTLVACGDSGPVGSGEYELIAGGSALQGEGFVALEDGADAELVPGSQGGFHIWISLRFRGASGRLFFEREARRASDGELILSRQRRPIVIPESAESEWWELEAASAAFMCPSPIGVRVYDELIRFHIAVGTIDETLAEDELLLMSRCPQGEERDFCLEICSG